MGLTCDCGDDYEWWYQTPDDYSVFGRKRATRCRSCGALVCAGETVLRFIRWRAPRCDFEERFHGDEVLLAPAYYCERCADLFWSLKELGFCINLDDDMRELVKEYAELYGPKTTT